jgi:hypothetical protein
MKIDFKNPYVFGAIALVGLYVVGKIGGAGKSLLDTADDSLWWWKEKAGLNDHVELSKSSIDRSAFYSKIYGPNWINSKEFETDQAAYHNSSYWTRQVDSGAATSEDAMLYFYQLRTGNIAPAVIANAATSSNNAEDWPGTYGFGA